MLTFPLPGPCRVENGPADRVPSHGTDAFGSSYAIDLVPVDDAGRSAERTFRQLIAAEPPERFVGFGQPVVAPTAGTVLLIHDGEPDHEARRSPITTVPYLLTQARRVRTGAPGLAGNHVVLAIGDDGPFRPARAPAAGKPRGAARPAARPWRPGGAVRQLGQQHRAAPAPPGQ